MADGMIAPHDNFIAFLQTVGDLPVIVVTDANLDGNCFDMIFFDDKHDVHRLGQVGRLFVRLGGICAGSGAGGN